MNQTLGDEVRGKFEKVLGEVSKPHQTFWQLRFRRVVIYAYLGGFGECLLGSWPEPWEGAPFPVVGIHLNLNASKPDRLKRGKILDSIAKDKGWRAYNLDKEGEYGGIALERSLAGFLEGKDHVHDIKRFFLDALDEVEKIKREHPYPELPWKAVPPGPEEETE